MTALIEKINLCFSESKIAGNTVEYVNEVLSRVNGGGKAELFD